MARAGRADLFVASEPPGASISVDEGDTGKKTPEVVEGLRAGKHQLVVQMGEEYGAFREVVTRPWELTKISLPLKRSQGEPYARVRPFGAADYVDGKRIGETPVKQKIPVGEREVEVRKGGYYPLKRKVRVGFGETAELTANLQALPKGTFTKQAVQRAINFALEAAGAIQESRRRAAALRAIARAQAQARGIAQALETARTIQDGYWRAGAFSSIARALAKKAK